MPLSFLILTDTDATRLCTAKVSTSFSKFVDKGVQNQADEINRAIVNLLCETGVPPRIAEAHSWKLLFRAINPKLSYDPPSSTTIRNKLIPPESTRAKLNMRAHVQGCRNLSLSFDGLTEGDQPLYTVHVATPDRETFLYRGDVFYGSHNSAYVEDLLQQVR
jgi:hypothetical protein